MFKQFLCAAICSIPELGVRNEELVRQNAVTLLGLLQSAVLANEESDSRACPEPGEATMRQMEQLLPAPARDINSRHLDSVRPVLARLDEFKEYSGDCFPTGDDVIEYFGRGLNPLRGPDGYGGESQESFRPYLLTHFRAYSHRRLFVCQSGLRTSFLGLGPASVEGGDLVWAVPGIQKLLVLRPTHWIWRIIVVLPRIIQHFLAFFKVTPRFQLVGESYVHGVMHGEMSVSDANMSDIVLV